MLRTDKTPQHTQGISDSTSSAKLCTSAVVRNEVLKRAHPCVDRGGVVVPPPRPARPNLPARSAALGFGPNPLNPRVVGPSFCCQSAAAPSHPEWSAAPRGDPAVRLWWFSRVPLMDACLAVPAVALTLVSAQPPPTPRLPPPHDNGMPSLGRGWCPAVSVDMDEPPVLFAAFHPSRASAHLSTALGRCLPEGGLRSGRVWRRSATARCGPPRTSSSSGWRP